MTKVCFTQVHPCNTHSLVTTLSHLSCLLRMMMKYLVLALTLGAAMAAPSEFEDQSYELAENEARFLYFNSSSTATTLTLIGALILLGVIFYLVYVGGLLAPSAGSYSNYQRYGQD